MMVAVIFSAAARRISRGIDSCLCVRMKRLVMVRVPVGGPFFRVLRRRVAG